MRAKIVQGMAFGDEGKGRITDLLVRETGSSLVVRFNGGPQAAHNVISPEGVHHTFSQFGSGTLAGASTHLSRFMLVDPLALRNELLVLRGKGFSPSISIDPSCVIITPFHRILNRAREKSRGERRHGSVGLGVGEARRYQIEGLELTIELLHSLSGKEVLRDIKKKVKHEISMLPGDHSEDFVTCSTIDVLCVLDDYQRCLSGFYRAFTRDVLKVHENVVFEGAQGVLLDEKYGFAPYNTWTDCTFKNAETLLEESGRTDYEKIGVFRTYFTRHGAGPFPTESPMPVVEGHNNDHPWMGGFRVGCFDSVLAQYAIDVAEPDVLAMTHHDQVSTGKYAAFYDKLEHLDIDPVSSENGDMANLLSSVSPQYWTAQGDLVDSLELILGVPVKYVTESPHGSAKPRRTVCFPPEYMPSPLAP